MTSLILLHIPEEEKFWNRMRQLLGLIEEKTDISREILRENGNMSSPTVLYVLERFMKTEPAAGR